MSEIKMKFADRKKLADDAKQEADVINDRELHTFLKECARWGGTKLVKAVLENIRIPKGKAKRKAWKKNAKDAGYKLRFPPAPQWCEVAAASLDAAIPEQFGVGEKRDVITPADPEADPPVEAVYSEPRPAKWSEFRLLITRTVAGTERYFAPLSNGVNYFDDDTVDAVVADAAVVGNAIDIEDLPEADAE